MKAREARLRKLEETHRNSPLELAKQVVRLLSQDPKYDAALARAVLASPVCEHPKLHKMYLNSLGEPLDVQPGDQDIIDIGITRIPDDLRRKLREVGVAV